MEHLRFAHPFQAAAKGLFQTEIAPGVAVCEGLCIRVLQVGPVTEQSFKDHPRGAFARYGCLAALHVPRGELAKRLAYAAGAPVFAGAFFDVVEHHRHDLVQPLVRLLGKAQAVGVSLVHEDGVPRGIDAADRMREVQGVAGHEERQQHSRRVADAAKPTVDVQSGSPHLFHEVLREYDPEGHRLQHHGRQLDPVPGDCVE